MIQLCPSDGFGEDDTRPCSVRAVLVGCLVYFPDLRHPHTRSGSRDSSQGTRSGTRGRRQPTSHFTPSFHGFIRLGGGGVWLYWERQGSGSE